MRLLASILLTIFGLAACGTTSAPINVSDILSVCHTSTTGGGCSTIDGKTISVTGIFKDLGSNDKLGLVPSADDTETHDQENLDAVYAVEILTNESERSDYNIYLNKNIIMTGKIRTHCVPKAIDMREHNKIQFQNENDEIIIHMLTGTCHYVTNPYMLDVVITVDSEHG